MTKRRTNNQSFAGIPRAVLLHKDYQNLSGNAVKLLLDLAFQYRGGNNGDLTTAFNVLKVRGWTSRATIDRAKKQLLLNELIKETRPGQFINPGGRCALYALTWAAIDEGKKRLALFGIRCIRQAKRRSKAHLRMDPLLVSD